MVRARGDPPIGGGARHRRRRPARRSPPPHGRPARSSSAPSGLHPSDRVLEIGCGIGRVGAELAPVVREWIGCDVSPTMLDHAREELRAFSNVQLLEISGFDLAPVAARTVDVVYCTVVFMHLDEWDRYGYVQEAFRVLRPGGRIYVDNFNLLSEEGWAVFEAHAAIPPIGGRRTSRRPRRRRSSSATSPRRASARSGSSRTGSSCAPTRCADTRPWRAWPSMSGAVRPAPRRCCRGRSPAGRAPCRGSTPRRRGRGRPRAASGRSRWRRARSRSPCRSRCTG